MKTLITLISALIFLSATVNADDIDKNKRKRNKGYSSVLITQFIICEPDADAPLDLDYLEIKKVMVPIAPFIWTNFPEDIPEELGMVKAKNAIVPVAPFVWGNSQEEVLDLFETMKLNNIIVPVSPFTWGNPEEIILIYLDEEIVI